MRDDIRAEMIKLVRRPAIRALLAIALGLSLTFTYLIPMPATRAALAARAPTAAWRRCCRISWSATPSAACRCSSAR
jgi:hypothetical protein